jgi:uncharacterized repeat protein (TIGR04076 family)
MKTLVVSVQKVLGTCTSTPPLRKGDFFTVRNGDIRIPEGRFMCLWALQSILPLIPAKERKIGEKRAEDWMWRVHHVQCPDPKGRVVFKIEAYPEGKGAVPVFRGKSPAAVVATPTSAPRRVRDLRVVVEEVKGRCTSGMSAGDFFKLEGCRLTIPAGRHFCLYALQAVLPFLAAKQRRLEYGDWLKADERFICPDPAGKVILRVEIL